MIQSKTRRSDKLRKEYGENCNGDVGKVCEKTTAERAQECVCVCVRAREREIDETENER